MSEITGCEIPINDIKSYIEANVELQLNKHTTSRLFMAGPPGCGKSDIMRQICEKNKWALKCIYISNMSLEQLTGIPCKIEQGSEAVWSKPEIFNFKNLEYTPENYDEKTSTTILFLDDIHLADKIFQKYLFQILTYKSLNGYNLPDKCAIILAGNRNTDRALANTIPAPVMNRISVYEVTSSSNDWLKNFAFKYGIRDDIASFIHAKGDVYLSQEPIENVPWASPRSWTFLSDQMNTYEKINGNISLDKLKIIATGLIGIEYTNEFIAYREIFSKWDINTFIKMDNNEMIKIFEKEVNKNPVAAYAIINAAVIWMLQKVKEYKFNVDDKNVIEIVRTLYNIMTNMLQINCNGCTIKPLIIAGTEYICLYQNSLESQITNSKNYDFFKILELFVSFLKQKRSIDWIYYEILSFCFHIDLSDDDIKEIEKAKKDLNIF
jgi:hypothetical protein